MNAIARLLESPEVLNALVAILGAAWAAFRATETYQSVRASKLVAENAAVERALSTAECAVAGAVTEVYQSYVESLKRGRADGKLTLAEIKKARDMAYRQSVALAQEQGLDIAKAVGPELIRNMIEQTVRSLKGGK